MKLTFGTILVLFAVASLTYAQNPPHFAHIIIVIQENRTPDNLFGGGGSHTPRCGSGDAFEPDVDIDNGGSSKGHNGTLCNISLPMNGLDFDPDQLILDRLDFAV